MARVISDAGPLIALAKADSLFVPRDLFTRIRIPEAVWLECVQKTGADSRRIEQAASEGWLNVVSVATMRNPPSLGIGETEAIQLALETEKALLIMDDRLARREATRCGLDYIGIVRMLHLAEQRSIVDNAEATIQRMAECGYRISPLMKLIRLGRETPYRPRRLHAGPPPVRPAILQSVLRPRR